MYFLPPRIWYPLRLTLAVGQMTSLVSDSTMEVLDQFLSQWVILPYKGGVFNIVSKKNGVYQKNKVYLPLSLWNEDQ